MKTGNIIQLESRVVIVLKSFPSLRFVSLQIQLGCPYMQESSVDWIFKGPACLVLIINLIFLFSIMWVSVRHDLICNEIR